MFNNLRSYYNNVSEILSSIELNVLNVLTRIGDLKQIDDDDDINYLKPYIDRLLNVELYEEKLYGLYIIDINGFYALEDSCHFDVVHLRRIGDTKAVYCLTTFPNTRLYFEESDNYVILFVNVIKTRNGFMFLNNEYACVPIPGNESGKITEHTICRFEPAPNNNINRQTNDNMISREEEEYYNNQ